VLVTGVVVVLVTGVVVVLVTGVVVVLVTGVVVVLVTGVVVVVVTGVVVVVTGVVVVVVVVGAPPTTIVKVVTLPWPVRYGPSFAATVYMYVPAAAGAVTLGE
jgi:hypothetical protein